MGASVWSARVPYQDDLEAALRQARVDAYSRDDFYRGDPNLRARAMREEEYVAWEMAELRRDLIARWEGAYVIAYAAGKPDTIFFVGHSGD